MERMLDKKQIQVIFLFVFKMGCKAAESTSSTVHLAQELFTSVQHTGGSRGFVKERRALMRSVAVTHWKLATTGLEPSPKRILLQEKLPENNIAHSAAVLHLQQIGKVKKLDKWVSHDKLTKKKRPFEVSSLFPRNDSEPFLYRVMTCSRKWIL